MVVDKGAEEGDFDALALVDQSGAQDEVGRILRRRAVVRTAVQFGFQQGDVAVEVEGAEAFAELSAAGGIKAADVPNLKPGSIDFPESVIDMLSGGLGQPDGG